MIERKSTLILKKDGQALTSSNILLMSRKAGAYLEADLSLSADVEIGDERVALKDKRIDASTIEASKIEDGNYQLSFNVVGATDRQTLLFDLDKLMGDNND